MKSIQLIVDFAKHTCESVCVCVCVCVRVCVSVGLIVPYKAMDAILQEANCQRR